MGWFAGFIAVGALAGASTASINFWDDYGWIPRAEYRLQHLNILTTAQTSDIYDLLKALKTGQDNNQDEWKCDELDEAIVDIELARLSAETNAEKVKLNRNLEKAKERWEKLDCSRFEID